MGQATEATSEWDSDGDRPGSHGALGLTLLWMIWTRRDHWLLHPSRLAITRLMLVVGADSPAERQLPVTDREHNGALS